MDPSGLTSQETAKSMKWKNNPVLCISGECGGIGGLGPEGT